MSVRSRRELITGHYETALEPDELIVEVRVPRVDGASRVPQVSLALARGPPLCVGRSRPQRRRTDGGRRRGRRAPQFFPELCVLEDAGRDRPRLRGGDRADLRRPWLGRIPAARDRRRGGAGGRGACRDDGPSPCGSGRARNAALRTGSRSSRGCSTRRILRSSVSARSNRTRRRLAASRRGRRADAGRRSRARTVRLPDPGPDGARRRRRPVRG